ncbi:MAG: TlpA family protein disulfide reductase [SAR324 cluster bacterium]|nr:TlpA family protein disulfide reductase [SAR324 cluster bacterium]
MKHFNMLLSGLLLWLCTGFTVFGASAPGFFISNLDGTQFISRKQTAPYVISFFFVGCVPCIKEIPVLYAKLSQDFPDVPLLFIDPMKDDSPESIRSFADKLGVPQELFYHDSQGNLARKFFTGEFRFPTLYGIKQKQVLFEYPGLEEKTMKEIEDALTQNMK